MSYYNLAFVMKTQIVNKGDWCSRVPIGTRENQPPLLITSGFITIKRLKSHLHLLEVVIFFQKPLFKNSD